MAVSVWWVVSVVAIAGLGEASECQVYTGVATMHHSLPSSIARLMSNLIRLCGPGVSRQTDT